VVDGWEETREDGGTDIVAFAPLFRSYPSNIPIHNPQERHTRFNKWRLNLDGGKVTEDRVLLDHRYERPSFNTAYVGQQSRFAYLLDEEMEGMMAKEVLTYDAIDERDVARLRLPQRVPFGVHSCWLNQEQVASLA
jgi:carotenoid 9,10(9',10')-cleavage dioxygenase 1